MTEGTKHISFKYVHPEDLRDLYVNGVWGGVTPQNEIFMHFYSERHAIPKKITHEINPDQSLGTVTSEEKGGDAVRLIQTSIVFNVATAIAFRDWLNDRINYINKDKKE